MLRWISISSLLVLLVIIYINQQIDYLNAVTSLLGLDRIINRDFLFAVNKTVRLVANDLVCLGLIKLLFYQPKYLKMAFLLFCVELLIILPVYLILKLTLEGDSEISSPFLSQIHRLIINPLLMLLLIVSFYYLKRKQSLHED